MGERNSEYERIPGDLYVTPQWVYDALYSVEPWARGAWDCAPVNADFDFLQIDIDDGLFIATNPPYSLAEEFCRHAISRCDKVAMLLPYEFDAAKTRRDLWEHPYKGRYNITQRIRWENLEQKKSGPSKNHAWFVWDRWHCGKPNVGLLPL